MYIYPTMSFLSGQNENKALKIISNNCSNSPSSDFLMFKAMADTTFKYVTIN